jgi:lysophospholipase L1-like esterase
MKLATVLALLCAATRLATAATASTAATGDFPGDVRLSLPKVIYAAPGLETNLYFDNAVLVINPLNYVFDVTCKQGYQFDDRWTYTPAAGDGGDYPTTLEVRDQSNAVIARARSTIRVAATQPHHPKRAAVTLLAIGDSHLQKDVYADHLLQLSKADDTFALTLVGCRGRGNKPPSDELRHEGYNGWTAEAFVTRDRPKPRTGNYVPAETGSPFLYTDDGSGGTPRLDFRKYCAQFNDGKPVDFVTIQLGGNDIWRATDDDIDATIDTIFGYYDQLIRMVHDYAPAAKIGIISLDTLTRSQHGFRNYRADRKQTRWQYRRLQQRMVEREIERFGGREAEKIYLVPVHLNIDTVHAFPMVTLPTNARMPEPEQRVNDGAHLSPEGYRQFGDAIYAWMKTCPLDQPETGKGESR